MQVFGKSLAEAQQDFVSTTPPECSQAYCLSLGAKNGARTSEDAAFAALVSSPIKIREKKNTVQIKAALMFFSFQ